MHIIEYMSCIIVHVLSVHIYMCIHGTYMKFHIHVLHVWYIHVHVLHVLMHTYGTCVPHVHVSVFCILQIKINNFFIFLHFYMYVIIQ